MYPVTLILVRHGHVEGIHPERFRGRIDLPLTELGHTQALVTARFIASRWQATAVYCSPLSRCVDTAKAIAEAQGKNARPLLQLTDIDYGKWQGRERDEVKAAEPEQFQAWMHQPHLAMIDGAEMLQDVQARLARALHQIRKDNADGTVVAVGHDSTNRVLLTMALGLSLGSYWNLQQDPCAINVLRFSNDACRVASMNETGHLAEKQAL